MPAGLTEWVFLSRSDKSDYLKDLTRDNVQLIVSDLWEQPTERVEESIVAKLPPPSFVLPRMRKCPVPRPLTKWEKYAQEKGIKKTKKAKKVFDEVLDVNYEQEKTCRQIDSVKLLYRNGYPLMDIVEPTLKEKRNGCWRFLRMLIQWRTSSQKNRALKAKKWRKTRYTACGILSRLKRFRCHARAIWVQMRPPRLM